MRNPLIILTILFLFSCKGEKEKILGNWYLEPNYDSDFYKIKVTEDSIYLFDWNYLSHSLAYKTEADTIILNGFEIPLTFTDTSLQFHWNGLFTRIQKEIIRNPIQFELPKLEYSVGNLNRNKGLCYSIYFGFLKNREQMLIFNDKKISPSQIPEIFDIENSRQYHILLFSDHTIKMKDLDSVLHELRKAGFVRVFFVSRNTLEYPFGPLYGLSTYLRPTFIEDSLLSSNMQESENIFSCSSSNLTMDKLKQLETEIIKDPKTITLFTYKDSDNYGDVIYLKSKLWAIYMNNRNKHCQKMYGKNYEDLLNYEERENNQEIRKLYPIRILDLNEKRIL